MIAWTEPSAGRWRRFSLGRRSSMLPARMVKAPLLLRRPRQPGPAALPPAVQHAGRSPRHRTGSSQLAVRALVPALLVLGGVGMMRAGAALGWATPLRLWAGAVLMFAHYTLTDWMVRGAMAEFTAMMVLPWYLAACIALAKGQSGQASGSAYRSPPARGRTRTSRVSRSWPGVPSPVRSVRPSFSIRCSALRRLGEIERFAPPTARCCSSCPQGSTRLPSANAACSRPCGSPERRAPGPSTVYNSPDPSR